MLDKFDNFITSRIQKYIASFASKIRRISTGNIVSLLYPPDSTPQYTKQGFDEFVKSGYTRNELIYACIDRTAKTAASVKLQIKNKRTGKVIDKGEFRDLLDHPNPLMSEYAFWHFTITMLLIAGCCYWQKVRKNGRVVALWPMRPDWTKPIPGKKQFIDGYEYGRYDNEKVFIPFQDVLDFSFYDPRNLYNHISPTAVACRVADTDNSTTDFIAMFWERGAIPQAVLSTPLNLDDDIITDIRRRWTERYGGWDNWLNAPAVLTNDTKYQPVASTFKDMDFEKLDMRAETRICMIYDIPPIIVGTVFGLMRSTLNNIGETESLWWRNSLIPRYKMLSDEVMIDLAGEFGDDVIVEFDFDNVSVLQEDRTAQFTRANSAVQAGYYTINMALQEIGDETLKPELGDVFLWTPAITPVHLNSIAERLARDLDLLRNPPEQEKPVLTDENTEQEDNPDDSGKSLFTESELIKKGKSEPLPHELAIEVEPFSQNEIDTLFDEWLDLPKRLS